MSVFIHTGLKLADKTIIAPESPRLSWVYGQIHTTMPTALR